MIELIDKKKLEDTYYYRIHLSYEIPYNVLESDDEDIITAKNILYKKLGNIIPEKYEKFSNKLVLSQLEDTMNYIVSYNAFFRSSEGLPMREYVNAEEVKNNVEKEIEEFFKSIDCEYRRLNIISFN